MRQHSSHHLAALDADVIGSDAVSAEKVHVMVSNGNGMTVRFWAQVTKVLTKVHVIGR